MTRIVVTRRFQTSLTPPRPFYLRVYVVALQSNARVTVAVCVRRHTNASATVSFAPFVNRGKCCHTGRGDDSLNAGHAGSHSYASCKDRE